MDKEELALRVQQLEEEKLLTTKWLALIAHDFKGMFNTLVWMLDAYDNALISEEVFLGMLPEIKVNAKLNLNTLNNTFQWVNTQLTGFNLQLEPLNTFELFAELNDYFKQKLIAKNITLVYNGDRNLIVESDRMLFKFILKKVVGNAIKYSYEGQEVTVAVLDSAVNTQIIIEDKGTGMDRDTLTDIFTLKGSPYNGTMDEKGVGLGLIIVKDFIKLLGGEIGVDSIENKGTKISLLVPKVSNLTNKKA